MRKTVDGEPCGTEQDLFDECFLLIKVATAALHLQPPNLGIVTEHEHGGGKQTAAATGRGDWETNGTQVIIVL